MNHYLLKLDYGDRKKENVFIKELFAKFDRDILHGAVLFANNNPYSLELLLFLNFVSNSDEFEAWLSANHPRERLMNFFLNDLFKSMANKSYNSVGLIDDPDFIDNVLSGRTNETFFFGDRDLMEKELPSKKLFQTNVFLSHSSSDKPSVDLVFNELQKKEVAAWYDRYEIKLGDSITQKINEGLQRADVGVLFLSKSFLNSKSGWTMSEANYFFQHRMKNANKKFIVVNMDLSHEEIPPLMQDYKYINYSNPIEIAVEIKNAL